MGYFRQVKLPFHVGKSIFTSYFIRIEAIVRVVGIQQSGLSTRIFSCNLF